MSTALLSARSETLQLESALCPICEREDVDPIAVGEDFEYRTCRDQFLVVRCRACQLVFLNPRPSAAAFRTIYPNNYHAFEFQAEQYGLVYRVRRRLEARRLLTWCQGLPANARILDVGCGDGFHLRILRDFGPKTWTLHGVDADARAIAVAQQHGLTAFEGDITSAPLEGEYDLAFLIMTIEHVAEPIELLRDIRSRLRPGGRLVVVTDNVGSPDFRIFGGRHWGGYHFPRHFHLFDRTTLATAANAAGFDVDRIRTAMSPVNWTYSLRNCVDDWGGPRWLVNALSLKSPIALGVFTLLDLPLAALGCGAILQGVFRNPHE